MKNALFSECCSIFTIRCYIYFQHLSYCIVGKLIFFVFIFVPQYCVNIFTREISQNYIFFNCKYSPVSCPWAQSCTYTSEGRELHNFNSIIIYYFIWNFSHSEFYWIITCSTQISMPIFGQIPQIPQTNREPHSEKNGNR
jgi:hypothetical protein